MCIGFPLQVAHVEPGHALVRADDGTTRRVRTALVGAPAPGDWLLVHLDSAVERLSPARAAEIAATLALLRGALDGSGTGPADASDAPFELPSRWDAQRLHRMVAAAPGAAVEPPCAEMNGAPP